MSVLLTTAYCPPGSYLTEAMQAEDIVIEASETYPKQTNRNHCAIFGPNGRQILTIPVIRTNGNHTVTRDILISAHQPWQQNHWRSIETAYNNSPFFLYYQDHFTRFYTRNYKFLLDFNLDILHVLLEILNHHSTIRLTDNYCKVFPEGKDFRQTFGTKQQISATSPPYTQVFESRHGFIPGLSILDILFNLGPETPFYLEKTKVTEF
jgi:hypothetical protein